MFGSNRQERKDGPKGARKSSPEDSIDREIAHHIDQLTNAYIAQGMSAEEARRKALVEFGGCEQIRQSVREVHMSKFVEAVTFNLKAALRFLRKSPSFSMAVILTLALGIGANSAVFSAIDAVLLRPLPFPEGDQLVQIAQHDIHSRDANHFVAPVRLEDWNRLNSTFESISGYYFDDLSETSGSLPEKVTEALVAPRFLQVMGISPMLGRDFTPREEHWGGPNAALISYRFWQRRFAGSPDAVGKRLQLGPYSYTIVGVLPASFSFPSSDIDLYGPSAPDAPFSQRRDSTWFTVIGRMKPGVTVHQAAADLINVQSQLGKQYPKPDSELTVETTPLKEVVIGSARSSLWLLYGSVSLLLLIACSNIAALLLARTAERGHEVSIRFSLGASRGSIVLQLLTEVFVLALIGSALGLSVAAAAAHEFHRLAATLPRAEEIVLNWRVALYSLIAALATTLLCGLFPALRGARRDLAHALASGSRTQASTRNPMQWVLVSVQVTLAVALLIGAGLLLRSLQQIARVYPGFDPYHVLTFQVSGSWGETANMKDLVQRIDRRLDLLRAIPGVEDAATAAMLPGVPAHYQLELTIDGNPDPAHPILATTRFVSNGYFGVMRIPLLAGKPCAESSTVPEVVVNRSFVTRYLHDSAAVGHALAGTAGNGFLTPSTIRGVVGDAREEGINEAPTPTAYFCASAPGPFPNFLVRTKSDPMSLAETIRQAIHRSEPSRSVYAFAPLQDHLDEVSSDDRLRTTLLALFAATAVALACIGLYGTLSYLGRLRQREIGVRLAMGALRGQIIGRFLLQGVRIALIGCAAGLALGVTLSRFLKGMLYGISALDPTTYTSVIGLILLVAALASLFPALRAAHVDPVKVLRDE